MTQHQFQVGPIKVNLPDENQNYFSIFHDLAELFEDEFQSDAVKKLRSKLKNVKPKASIEYEADNTHITTSNADTLVVVITAIEELATEKFKVSFQQLDTVQITELLKAAKKNRPKPKEWQTGDVFSIPLLNDTFAFGQVLDKKYCTCALFNLQSDSSTLTEEQFKRLQPISILHLSNGDLLNNGHWNILYNQTVTLNPSSGSGGRFGDIGSSSYGQCKAMTDLANAYWGLEPWNVMYREDYYDQLLLKGLTRPKTAHVLNEADRKTFRKEKFGVE
ncbi:Imm26 family immunity protein [Lacibacter sediminis]|uniref:Uncharacterized protein n=1 Tax=Lacibacter sediminis TaxID=2760713 RepID=A0A7G5XB48_9BACT|nr:Imm26 family immunity protein [Lacibacter sediminis]QNA42701.1 hypothetical protein H4075_11360 [Lacibacter sediminis]